MDLCEKVIKHRGKEHPVYFRPLTVLDTQKLLRGQKAAVGEDGKARVELDYAAEYQRSLLLVELTLVDVNGRRVYQTPQALHNESSAWVAKLIAAAKEAEKELNDEGN